MARKVLFDEKSFLIQLTGATSFFSLKSKIEIPYQNVKHVEVRDFKAPIGMIKMPGTAVPPIIYEGTFKYQGKSYFLSYEKNLSLVYVELEGHAQYDYVIFQMDDPVTICEEIKDSL